jgi:biotin operon repressor
LGLRLSKLNLEETKLLIESRTKLIGKVHKDIFNEEVTSMIYQYSKGIPRNVISACNLLFTSNGRIITKDYAEGLLKEKYIERLIDDRIEDLEQRRIYKTMILILKEKFGGKADSQEDYINRVREVLDIGRNKVMKYIDEMTKNGILSLNRGGYNRINKIISIGEETE